MMAPNQVRGTIRLEGCKHFNLTTKYTIRLCSEPRRDPPLGGFGGYLRDTSLKVFYMYSIANVGIHIHDCLNLTVLLYNIGSATRPCIMST